MVDLRRMTDADIPAGLQLCRSCGWNQLEPDWRYFLDNSPEGCIAAVEDGRVVGTVATLRYEDRFSWISMLLVDPEMRRCGIGMRLLQEALRLLEDVETVRLDATPAGLLVYDQCGFRDEYGLVRLKGGLIGGDASGVRPMTEHDLPRVCKIDREVFGADRSAILFRLFRAAPEYAVVAEGSPGYAFGRHGFHAEQIGPVVAVDGAVARRIVSYFLAANYGRRFVIDVAQHNAGWGGWLEEAGFIAERPFVRMCRGPNPYPGLPGRQFAIAGPELG